MAGTSPATTKQPVGRVLAEGVTRLLGADERADYAFGSIPPYDPCDKRVYVELPSLAGIKRTFAPVDFQTKAAKLFHMGKQLPADGLLIGFRQRQDFVDGIFHDFDHV
jgi:hypothetical protein